MTIHHRDSSLGGEVSHIRRKRPVSLPILEAELILWRGGDLLQQRKGRHRTFPSCVLLQRNLNTDRCKTRGEWFNLTSPLVMVDFIFGNCLV